MLDSLLLLLLDSLLLLLLLLLDSLLLLLPQSPMTASVAKLTLVMMYYFRAFESMERRHLGSCLELVV